MVKKKLNYIRLLFVVFYKCLRSIKALFVLHIISKILIVSIPLIHVHLFSTILQLFLENTSSKNQIIFFTALYIFTILFGKIIGTLNNLIETQISLKITQKTHILFNQTVLSFPLSYIDSPKGKNDIQLLLTSYEFYPNIYYGVVNIVSHLYAFIAAFCILAKYNSWYAVSTVFLVLPIIVYYYKNRKNDNNFEAEQIPIRATKNNYMNMLTSKSYSMDIRLYNVQKIFTNKYIELVKKLHDLYKFNYRKRLSWGLLFQSLMVLGQIALTCHLLMKTYFGIITVADLSLVLGYITSVISTLISSGTLITDVIAKILWIEEYSVSTSEKMDYKYSKGINISSVQSIEFNNVWFRYPGANFDVLRGVSFSINKGEKISIVGVNGVGKTTCVKLLLGIYKPDKGTILINNIPIDRYSEESLYNMFSCVFQNYIIYPFSLKENIKFGSFDINESKDELDAVLKTSGCSKFVDGLKSGIDTFLSRQYSSDGAELSQGQKQSVVIARSILKRAPVKIFDEPSSALDAENENELLSFFEGLTQEEIGILISHRLSSTIVSDKIILLDNGIVKESGNHYELLKQGGLYSQMYSIQKKQYGEDS